MPSVIISLSDVHGSPPSSSLEKGLQVALPHPDRVVHADVLEPAGPTQGVNRRGAHAELRRHFAYGMERADGQRGTGRSLLGLDH